MPTKENPLNETLLCKSISCLILLFSSCVNTYDHDLMYHDGYGGGYNLTLLGCLVNGPRLIDESIGGFNTKLFLKDSEICSIPSFYDEAQKDLIFQLHKNGTITYWLKYENRDTPEVSVQDGKTTAATHSHYGYPSKKLYTTGYWKVNFADSTIQIHFQNKNIADFNFKFSYLSSSTAEFQQTLFADSLFNGKMKRLKKINTLHYRILYTTL